MVEDLLQRGARVNLSLEDVGFHLSASPGSFNSARCARRMTSSSLTCCDTRMTRVSKSWVAAELASLNPATSAGMAASFTGRVSILIGPGRMQ